jgi:hypothetical protein
MTLLNMMNRNRAINIMFIPRVFSRSLNSLWSVCVKSGNIEPAREGASQYRAGIVVSPISRLSQLSWIDIIEEEGSNTENRLVIIFRGLWRGGVVRERGWKQLEVLKRLVPKI